ncbi:M12 family metallo-peptidase [Candidatus Thiothrix sp. Deng01]|uniref:M12 family metallo-peptidase n=1 Tax=Candidatus Thiothrix phosphatis TaxID=3112415 RepID=A0ABU6CVL1_9GAMM|nr:M12 family metallo-peptidase [Candidatus Thiothrix sp. Deng01]MEB4590891.1 M12 family metallo-peptidase [Candidatus Thiothrix sp. Deng01]
MKRMAISLALMLAANANADDTPWRDIQARGATTGEAAALKEYRLLSLDEAQLKTQLLQMPTAASATDAQARASAQTFSIPLPNGGFVEVTATPTEVLAPEIAADHPDIQTWKLLGVDGSAISGVADFTSRGFHAMLDMANGDTLFIDPQENSGTRQYLSFTKNANWEAFRQSGWSCPVHGGSALKSFRTLPSGVAARTAAKAGDTLHTYRLAIAATGEYTQFYKGQSAAYASLVSAVNRINQIYERDLSIHLSLASNTNTVYTSASSDPYTMGRSSDITPLLAQNQSNLDQVIGNSNYDVGHVVTTDGGGLAEVGVICNASLKAQGATGLSNPSGDAFVVDYLAHELGHEFGATHTFNSQLGACAGSNRQPSAAFEPGSGSTIMAYTGLCGSDNLQENSDTMMHSASISQIIDYAFNDDGASCATSSSLSNSTPTANAGSDYTIPARTPFILSGSGSDTNGDSLSYSWEQVDAGSASYVNVDLGNNALIRTHLPTTTPNRTIPQMSDLMGHVQSTGEYLPVTSRTLNFRLQVRDGRGGTSYDDMRLTVKDTGSSFAVTSPTATSFVAGSPLAVSWDVAGTNQSPVNCSTVDIAVTTDNGSSFTDLLTGTPNDGGANVTLPSKLGSSNYIRVKCSNNLFFAMSATAPAVASPTNTIAADNSSDDTTSNSVRYISGGGGGSAPVEWIAVGGLYVLLRRLHKGTSR